MKKRPDWPAYVSEANGRVVYRPRIKGDPPSGYGVDSRGFLKPPIAIGKPSDSGETILRSYIKVKEMLADPEKRRKHSLFWLAEKYFQSTKFSKLATGTQKSYRIHLSVFLNYDIQIDARPAKLGNLRPTQLSLPMINTIKDRLYKRSGGPGNISTSYVNAHIRTCRALLGWAVNNIEGLGIVHNPLAGISLDPENIRRRSVTDEEYMTQYLFAVENGPAYLPMVFEHAYMLACRSIEVCDLTVDSILPEGYKVCRRKNSNDNIIKWSPRLEAARDAALMLREKTRATGNNLITSMRGGRLNDEALQSAMRHLKKGMVAAGLGDVCWNLHDLKRKGISDAKDRKIGGHKSEHIINQYMVKLKSYEPAA